MSATRISSPRKRNVTRRAELASTPRPSRFDVEQLRMGVRCRAGALREISRRTSPTTMTVTARIARVRLNEFPDCYSRLAVVEADVEAYWAEQAQRAQHELRRVVVVGQSGARRIVSLQSRGKRLYVRFRGAPSQSGAGRRCDNRCRFEMASRLLHGYSSWRIARRRRRCCKRRPHPRGPLSLLVHAARSAALLGS